MSMFRVTLKINTNLDPHDWIWDTLLITDPTHESVEVEAIEEIAETTSVWPEHDERHD